MPIGRRISIETLEGRVLAIDASIWLTQFLTVAAAQQENDRESSGGGIGRSGAAGRNYDYLVGFLRRLCKLRFQGVRPVLVFDGATPEIKQREMRARRARQKRKRETFLDDSVTSGGDYDCNDDEGIKRVAKRLLLQQLKKAGVKKKIVAISFSKNNKTNKKNTGSEAPGFYNPDAPDTSQQQQLVTVPAKTMRKMDEKEIIELLEDDEYLRADDENEDRDGGDWDDAIITGQTNEQEQGQQDEKDSNNDPNQKKGLYDNKSSTSSMVFHNGDGTQFEIEQVASLKPSQRKDIVEDAQRRRRLQSRREFLKVASDPLGLSQCQLRNFLKSSKLNQDIAQMAKRAAQKEEEEEAEEETERNEDATDEEYVLDEDEDEDGDIFNRKRKNKKKQPKHRLKKITKSNNRRRNRIIFEKFAEEHGINAGHQKKPTAEEKEQQLQLYRSKKLSLLHDEKKSDDEGTQDSDDDGEIDWGDNGIKTAFHYSTSRPAIQDESDEDSDGNNHDSGDHGDVKIPGSAGGDIGVGAGFVRQEEARSSKQTMATSTGALYQNAYAPNSPRQASKLTSRRIYVLDDDDDVDDDSESSRVDEIASKVAAKTDAQIAQELQDEQLARVLQLQEHDGEENINGDIVALEDVASMTVVRAAASMPQPSFESVASAPVNDPNSRRPTDGKTIQKLRDEELAKSLQKVEYARTRPQDHGVGSGGGGGGGGFFIDEKSITVAKTKEDSKFAKQKFEQFGPIIDSIDPDFEQEDQNLDSDDDENDDVEWEDGDGNVIEVDRVTVMVDEPNPSIYAQKVQMKKSDMKTSGTKYAAKKNHDEATRVLSANECDENGENSDEEDDVDWEDCDGEISDSPTRNKDISKSLQQNLLVLEAASRKSPLSSEGKAVGCQRNDNIFDDEISDEDMLEPEGKSNLGFFRDEWGLSQSKRNQKSNEIDDALQHAQETASKLTNWAGQAFRRAVAQHAKENGLVVPEAVKPKVFQAHQKKGCSKFEEVSDIQSNKNDASLAEISTFRNSDEEKQDSSIGKVDNSDWFKLGSESTTSAADHQNDNLFQTGGGSNVGSSEPFGGGGITDEMRSEVMQLLHLFGVPYVVAPAEAEAQCVTLEKLKLVDGIVTEDSDTFVFGGQVVYKNIFDDQKYVEVYNAKDASEEMNLTRDALVALALLLGGDYTEGVKGVGIVNGMEILHAFDVHEDCKAGLTRFKQWLDGFDLADASSSKDGIDGVNPLSKERIFHNKHRSARTRWIASKTFPDPKVLNAYLNPVVDKSRDKFTWGTPNVEGLVEFCHRQMGWSAEETKRLVVPVVEKMERDKGMHQTRMDHFMTYDDGIKFAAIRSQRLKDVLDGVKSRQTTNSMRQYVDKVVNIAANDDDEDENGI